MSVVQVLSGDDAEYVVVDARIARMILWLARRQTDIERIERGKIEFNFAGGQSPSVRAAMTLHDDVQL